MIMAKRCQPVKQSRCRAAAEHLALSAMQLRLTLIAGLQVCFDDFFEARGGDVKVRSVPDLAPVAHGGEVDQPALEIAQTAFTAVRLARQHHVPARWLSRVGGTRGSHVKLVVADDNVLIGSHNWSGGAFSGQIQDSTVVTSAPLAARLASFFSSQWSRAKKAKPS